MDLRRRRLAILRLRSVKNAGRRQTLDTPQVVPEVPDVRLALSRLSRSLI